MKKNNSTHYRRTIIAGLLALSMTTITIPANLPSTSAAAVKKAGKSKISITASAKGTILTGESRTLTIKNVKKKSIKKVTVTSSKKNVASVKKDGKKKVVILSKKAGKTTVRIKVTLKNNKKHNLKYTATVADTVDRKVKVLKSDKTTYTMTLRFFSKTPHIPYVHITDFYKQLSGGAPLNVQEKHEGEYLLTTPNGMTATIYTDTDVLESEDYREFEHVYPPEEGEASNNSDYGGAPFLEPLPDEVLEPGKPFTVSYSNYDIDLLGDKNDIWFPLEAAANTFMTGYGASMVYSGSKIYHYTSDSQLYDLPKTNFFNEYISTYPNGKRPADLVDYTYRQLMFLMDVQYGNPGRGYLSDAIRKKGMNRTLSETDDKTRAVKKLLKSSSLMDYIMGLGILGDMLFDGGHTILDYYAYYPYEILTGSKENTYQSYISSLQAAADKIGYKLENTPDPYWDNIDMIKTSKEGWEDFDYHEEGDTAIYSMGSMYVDKDAWDAFYEKGGEEKGAEIPNDSYGRFIQYLNKASKNKKIKNFVIDLTTNTGGDTNPMIAMMEIMADAPYTYIRITGSDKLIRCPFKADTNLDGIFDEKDREVKYPFRFAVMTSRCSFSCGNMLPFLAQSHGIMVLGERSGGGSCAITSPALGDGLPCLLSDCFEFTTKDRANIDKGVTPDKELEIKKKEDGTADYNAFFDIPALSKCINEFYK